MKIRINKTWLAGCAAGAALAAATACSGDAVPESGTGNGKHPAIQLTATATGLATKTRAVATEQLQDEGFFLEGEQIDIWYEDASSSDPTEYTGMPYVYESDGAGRFSSYAMVNQGTAEEPMYNVVENVQYWPQLMHGLNAYGLYPSGLAGEDAITLSGGTYPSYPFTVSADQTLPGDGAGSDDAIRGYRGSDLMLGVPKNGNPLAQTYDSGKVPMTFTHMLSKIIVELVIPEGGEYTEEQLREATVTILNTKPSTTFCVKTMSITAATGTETPITARRTDSELVYDEATQQYVASVTHAGLEVAAIIVPQTVAASTPFIRVEVGGNTFALPLDAETTFEGSKAYTFRVDMQEAHANGLTATVGDWSAGEDLGNEPLYY